MRRIFQAVFVALHFLLAGCTTQVFVKAYSGPDRPEQELALLKNLATVEIVSIDGNRNYSVSKKIIGLNEGVVALIPGMHEVEIVATDDPTFRPYGTAKTTFFAETGHKYVIGYRHKKSRKKDWEWEWWAVVKDVTDRPDHWCMWADLDNNDGGCVEGQPKKWTNLGF
jgi:hypothetical protein